MSNNSKTNYSERSAEQRSIDRLLSEVWTVPSEIDSVNFLIRKSGLYDEYIMPEIRNNHK